MDSHEYAQRLQRLAAFLLAAPEFDFPQLSTRELVQKHFGNAYINTTAELLAKEAYALGVQVGLKLQESKEASS